MPLSNEERQIRLQARQERAHHRSIEQALTLVDALDDYLEEELVTNEGHSNDHMQMYWDIDRLLPYRRHKWQRHIYKVYSSLLNLNEYIEEHRPEDARTDNERLIVKLAAALDSKDKSGRKAVEKPSKMRSRVSPFRPYRKPNGRTLAYT